MSEPPFGKGSVGIEVGGSAEKVDFGNEVDFFGDSVLGLTAVGFYVFQTGENTGGNPMSRNMPNIRFELDANLSSLPADNYTTMVWVPGPAPVVDKWSSYIDATTSGNWYFTGAEGGPSGTNCSVALNCNFVQAMTALSDGGDAPIIYTAAVGKGRDSAWQGAVDGLRINKKIYDFEAHGVHAKDAKN